MRKERTIELVLHDQTLSDLVAAHLYAIGVLRHNEDAVKIKFGEPDSNDLRKLSFTFIEERTAETLIHK